MRLCKLWADRHQRVHEFHAVLSHAAARHSDAVSDLLLIAPARRDYVVVLHGTVFVNIRIAGVKLLCPFVVGAQRLGRAALVLCKS